MSNLRLHLWITVIFLASSLVVTSPAASAAETVQYRVLLDTDASSATGCTVVGPGSETFVGADRRLTIAATYNAGVGTVTGVTWSECLGGSFGTENAVSPGGWPVGIHAGVDGSDLVEGFLPLAALGHPGRVFLGVLAEGETASDALFTRTGQANGSRMWLLTGDVSGVPAATPRGLGIALLVLGGVAVYGLRRQSAALRALLVLGTLSGAAAAVWAATIVMDGQAGDWAGIAPLGTKAAGSAPEVSIAAVFGTADTLNLYVRIDVAPAPPPATSTATATETNTPTATDTSTGTPSETNTATATATAAGTETATGTVTDTATATATDTPTATDTDTATATDTPTATDTDTATATDTPTATDTDTATATATPCGDNGQVCCPGDTCDNGSCASISCFCNGAICLPSCFSGETLVATSDGMREIRDIQVGDLVWGADEGTGTVTLQHVAKTMQHVTNALRLIEAGGEVIRTTDEHPFWVVGRGWTHAGDVVPGDLLRDKEGNEVAVLSSTSVPEVADVYNLEVEGFHTYFVSDAEILVHNKAVPVAPLGGR